MLVDLISFVHAAFFLRLWKNGGIFPRANVDLTLPKIAKDFTSVYRVNDAVFVL